MSDFAIFSVSRTESFFTMSSLNNVSCCSGLVASIISGLVWPSVMRRSINACLICSGKASNRKLFETYSRDLPIFLPISAWEKLNSCASFSNATARSIGFKSSRWRFSIIANSNFNFGSSVCARIITGTWGSPASLLARRRRSPAINSYSTAKPDSVSNSRRVTTNGCKTPYWRIESDNSRKLSWSNSLRGW